MQSPCTDNLAPLPVFSRRKTSRLRGPRPSSWLQTGIIREESEGSWSWTRRQADLSRTSTIRSCTSSDSSLSNQSSLTSESSSGSSSYIDEIQNSSFDHQSSRRHKRCPQRRIPSGPRPLSRPHSPNSPMRPTLSVNTSLLPPITLEQPVLPLPLAEFPHIAPTEPTTPAPQLPPAIVFSPSDILDWDTIFEVLALESNP